MDEKIERFQSHLALLRKCSGWTLDALGQKIGVTRQMIYRLENRHNKMTLIQYRALRQVFDEAILLQPEETKVLQDLLIILIDQPEAYTDEQKEQVLTTANLLAPSLASDQSAREKSGALWGSVLAGAAIGIAVSSLLPLGSTTAALIASLAAAKKHKDRKDSRNKDQKKGDNDDGSNNGHDP